MPSPSQFARGVTVETAFNVLAVAKRLKAAGKEVAELEIGDSPFATTSAALRAGVEALRSGETHYCPSAGLPEFREAAAQYVAEQYGVAATAENIVVAPGAKVFELLFCETFLDAGDGVLVFGPYFPTYVPNIARRGARAVMAPLRAERGFRPDPADVARFLREDAKPKAIFLNSPHNPTGGVAEPEDLKAIADLVRGKDIAVFSDEPYDRMVWRGRHHTILEYPDMLAHTVAAYTFSKSFSMSGWRLGFVATSAENAAILAKLVNSSLSCTPPFVQRAGVAALREDLAESDEQMGRFREKVDLLVARLNETDEVRCVAPGGTFYVFPDVSAVCRRLGITSHGLAMYLLEAADDRFGVACLGGECFGPAGAGYLRFSCAEPNELLHRAMDFLPEAWSRTDRVRAFLAAREEFRLAK